MKLTRDEKEQLIEKVREHLETSKAVLLVNFTNLKVKEERELKKKLRQHGIVFGVIKNSLFKIALKKTKISLDESLLDQPIALIWSANDEVAPAKITVGFAKETEKLKLVGGIIDQKFVDPDLIKQLAALPSREELYARLVGSLNAPMTRLVNALQGNLRSLVYILKQYNTRQESKI
jgi:large subunit ribosomal protein L10